MVTTPAVSLFGGLGQPQANHSPHIGGDSILVIGYILVLDAPLRSVPSLESALKAHVAADLRARSAVGSNRC